MEEREVKGRERGCAHDLGGWPSGGRNDGWPRVGVAGLGRKGGEVMVGVMALVVLNLVEMEVVVLIVVDLLEIEEEVVEMVVLEVEEGDDGALL